MPISLLEKLDLIREIVEETTDGLTLGEIQDGGEELLEQIKNEYLDTSIIDDGTNDNGTATPNTPSVYNTYNYIIIIIETRYSYW